MQGKRLASLLAALALVCFGLVGVQGISYAANKPTVVSLTFDDADGDQYAAAQTLQANGLKGTFYITSGFVGASGYLSRTNLTTMASWGHEIGGHTVTHPDLTQIDPVEAKRQICDDRFTLQSWGFSPVSFAYPFSTANAAVEQLSKDCGYNTARGLGDVKSPSSCSGCVAAETMPPPDPSYLRAPDQVDSSWTLAKLKKQVTQANAKGGWVVLTFHHVCATVGTTACPSDQSTTTATFNSFVSWLKTYSATAANATTVKTVDQTVRGYLGAAYPAYQTAVQMPGAPPAPVGVNALNNPSLETPNSGTGFPQCFQPAGWGTNTVAWSSTNDANTGVVGEQLDVTSYASGDAKLMPMMDLGSCSPTVIPGHIYSVSTAYKSTGITQFALYYRDSAGLWYYWTSSPWFTTSATWTTASFTTPPAPAAATGASFGLALIANGTLVSDDYSFVDTGSTGTASLTSLSAARITSSSAAEKAITGSSTTAVPGLTKAGKPITKRLHSHVRPYLPGAGKVGKGTRVLPPELGLGKG